MSEHSSFVPHITIEEYEEQKKTYTQKALKELAEQMKMQPVNNNSKNNDDEFELGNEYPSESDYMDSDIDNAKDANTVNDIPHVNVIINNANQSSNARNARNARGIVSPSQSTTLRKRKSNNNQKKEDDNVSLTQSIYMQREIELQELNKIKASNRRLQLELNEQERKNHFLKLELNNALIDNANLTIKVNMLEKENVKLKEQAYKDWMAIMLLKILLVLFIIQFIYNLLF